METEIERELEQADRELKEQKIIALHRIGLLKLRNQFDKETIEMVKQLLERI